MTSTDAFALRDSDLNAFLHADIGTELNGSSLTMLSVIARLGQDPWAEAAMWSTLPKASAIDCMVRSISKMPLVPAALASTRQIAERLSQLLPVQTRTPARRMQSVVADAPVPAWVLIAFVCITLLIGLAANLTSGPVSVPDAPTPIVRTIDNPAPIPSR